MKEYSAIKYFKSKKPVFSAVLFAWASIKIALFLFIVLSY